MSKKLVLSGFFFNALAVSVTNSDIVYPVNSGLFFNASKAGLSKDWYSSNIFLSFGNNPTSFCVPVIFFDMPSYCSSGNESSIIFSMGAKLIMSSSFNAFLSGFLKFRSQCLVNNAFFVFKYLSMYFVDCVLAICWFSGVSINLANESNFFWALSSNVLIKFILFSVISINFLKSLNFSSGYVSFKFSNLCNDNIISSGFSNVSSAPTSCANFKLIICSNCSSVFSINTLLLAWALVRDSNNEFNFSLVPSIWAFVSGDIFANRFESSVCSETDCMYNSVCSATAPLNPL